LINTFEFIEVSSWCRLADNKLDLFQNQNTYIPIFECEHEVFGDKERLINSLNPESNNLFFDTPSTNTGFKIKDLILGVEIGGSVLAHLSKVIIKDSSLLVLVTHNLSLVEGYGNKHWADYQLKTWPNFHNYPLCTISAENLPVFKERLKVYEIKNKIQDIPIAAIYLSVRKQDSNFYHWVIETLVRLKCLDDIPELKKIPLIVREPLNEFQKETLNIMGIENKLIITNGESFVIDDLFFPSIPSTPPQHRTAMRWLREKFLSRLPQTTGPKKRLYISRIDSDRQVVNEGQIFEFLEKLGYEKLIMSKLAVKDQINCFRSAESIVIPHGAAGTHILFAPSTCRVIELHSPKWINHCYFSLCNNLGISYRWIIGTQIDDGADYSIDINELKILLLQEAPFSQNKNSV